MSRKPRCFYTCACGHRFRAAVVVGLGQVSCPSCGLACGSWHVSPPLPRGGVVKPRHLTDRDRLAAGLALGDDALGAGVEATPAPFAAPIDQIAHIDPSTPASSENLPTMPATGPQAALRRTADQERALRSWRALNGDLEPSETLQAWSRLLPYAAPAPGGRGEPVPTVGGPARREIPADVQRVDPLQQDILYRLGEQARRDAEIILASERVVVAWRGRATAGGWAMSENLRALARLLDERAADAAAGG